jgi:hypothetical protein
MIQQLDTTACNENSISTAMSLHGPLSLSLAHSTTCAWHSPIFNHGTRMYHVKIMD